MMSHQFSRMDRITTMMQRTLATIIQREVKDPRLPDWITISAMTVSKDLRHAKVFFTVLNDDAGTTAEILNAAAGYIRKSLATKLKLRVVPHLRFVYDDSVAYGNRLSHLIDEVNATKEDDESDQ